MDLIRSIDFELLNVKVLFYFGKNKNNKKNPANYVCLEMVLLIVITIIKIND